MGEHMQLPPMCRADRDGDCNWEHCPQKHLEWRSHCPIDALYFTYCDEEGFMSRRHEEAWAAIGPTTPTWERRGS
jgi:hypothetical protein